MKAPGDLIGTKQGLPHLYATIFPKHGCTLGYWSWAYYMAASEQHHILTPRSRKTTHTFGSIHPAPLTRRATFKLNGVPRFPYLHPLGYLWAPSNLLVGFTPNFLGAPPTLSPQNGTGTAFKGCASGEPNTWRYYLRGYTFPSGGSRKPFTGAQGANVSTDSRTLGGIPPWDT